MTERQARSVVRGPRSFTIGPSQMAWTGDTLVIDIEEVSLPFLQPVRGRVSLRPENLSTQQWNLDHHQQHFWGPICLNASLDVQLNSPKLKWKGHAYFDQNEGLVPINDPGCSFRFWDWSRALLQDGSTVVTYDIESKKANEDRLLGLRFSPNSGLSEEINLTERKKLPTTAWGIKRRLRSHATEEAGAGSGVKVLKTLENTPFYSRNLLSAPYFGQSTQTMHESLDIARLASPIVQTMLPFKMPRELANT